MWGVALGAAVWAAAPLLAQAADIKSPRIASTSLCGDSYVLALAPKHVNALSWQSQSPLSLASPEQKSLPQVWDDPERLASFETDLIVFGPGEGQFASKLPTRSFILKWGEDFKTVFENAHALSLELNTGHDVIKLWKARLEALKTRKTRDIRPTVLYMSRSGGTAGKGTFVDAAIEAAGGQNLIASFGWSSPDPEKLLGLSPDLIVTSYFAQGYESVQANAIRHKAVAAYISRHPRVDIPGHVWPCAGPGLIEAAERIAKGLDALESLPDSSVRNEGL